MTSIFTDKYKLTITNVGDTVCLAIDEAVGDDDGFENVVNIALPFDRSQELEHELAENNDVVACRIEDAKASEEKTS